MEFCIIDDDKIYQFLMKKTIESISNDVEVKLFHDGLDAISRFKKDGVCCSIILLDLNMPNMDGWQFIQEYKKLEKTCGEKHKIYIATSSISSLDKEKAKQFKEIDGYLTKPITKNKLLEILV
ncbi:response regulator [Mesonia aquimarina]|uniref:response regulator n=1 Tax=Mesonia aquimarina TaxID=1504967 RepID=UPI000EF5A3F9|nr:response regulator [Mesonia aquimarina]